MQTRTNLTGLSTIQVLENRKTYGSNTLTPPKKQSMWVLLGEKFKDPLIIILLVAMTLSFIASAYQFSSEGASVFLEPVGILVAVLMAVGVSFGFEMSANKKFDILNKENDSEPVKVIRNGNFTQVPREEIVVGDIVILEGGDEVPADGVLIESVQLCVNESVLTGEPMANKGTKLEDFKQDATYPSNQVMRGTTVIDGNGVMKVTKVGDKTEYGKVYKGSQIDNNIKTPLSLQLERLSHIITIISYVIAGLIIVGRFIMLGNSTDWNFDGMSVLNLGSYILETIMLAVTIVVVAVPEGLPMSVSLSLALSMRRMLKTNNLVRKMHACETMGAATVICTDKTGTLTQNQMQVKETYVYGYGENQERQKNIYDLMEVSIALNSTANIDFSGPTPKGIGNPTECALLLRLMENKVYDYRDIRNKCLILEQSSFSTEKKYMATKAAIPESLCEKDFPHGTPYILLVKGAPEIVADMCETVDWSDGRHPIGEFRDDINTRLLEYQNRAMRTLGFAYKFIDRDDKVFDERGSVIANDLTFLAVMGIADPVREDVPDAVKECLAAGINVKIVTGDTPGTAKEIGRQIGLWTADDNENNCITGPEFMGTDDETLLERLDDIKIISRARPMDKQRLVKLLQQKGEVVAVTGDGTNDAPALKAAQVGLSMGDGTPVAKEASAITILDNSFKSINRAVLWGRSLYRNIQRFILFQLTINVTACIIVLLGTFTGLQSPLTVTQMLWVNIIMDTFAAMALASLPPEEKVMRDKPRNTNDNIVTREIFGRVVTIGLLFVTFLMGLLHIFKCNDITSLTQLWGGEIRFIAEEDLNGLSAYECSLFFTIFVFLQFWNLFNAKSFGTGYSCFRQIGRCKSFLMILLLIFVGQVVIVNIGGTMFNVVRISLSDWGIIIAGTSVVLIVGELSRLIMKLFRKIKS